MSFPDATFLHFAAEVKQDVDIPVIAVGRLGNPDIARAAVEDGKADFIALGRSLIADPQWVAKVARDEPVRCCLACNTCINEMRGGARISCLVNAAAGREILFSHAQPPRGERIAVIGAGPAGLTYASLVAEGNQVTVYEKAKDAGGAFRHAGKAPLFQEVEANEKSFNRYIAHLVAACEMLGVRFRYATDVGAHPMVLESYDRIVIATGAEYRHRWLGAIATWMLNHGLARAPAVARLFTSPKLRNWFYYKARVATGKQARALIRPGQKVNIIGDALHAGKSKDAIASAFAAALLPHKVAAHELGAIEG